MGNKCIGPYFLGLGSRWNWVIRITPRQIHRQGNRARYLLVKRLGGPQSRSRRLGKEKFLDPKGIELRYPRSSSPYPVAIPTILTLLFVGQYNSTWYLRCVFCIYLLIPQTYIWLRSNRRLLLSWYIFGNLSKHWTKFDVIKPTKEHANIQWNHVIPLGFIFSSSGRPA
jgi:hypothetical protein